MSQYSGNDTNFKPTYSVDGETTPIGVQEVPMVIDGKTVPGYQATYANGISKWTAAVHTDQVWDRDSVDNSTFTSYYDEDLETWKWVPSSSLDGNILTSDLTSIRNLWNDARDAEGNRFGGGAWENDTTLIDAIDNNFNGYGEKIDKNLNDNQLKTVQEEYNATEIADNEKLNKLQHNQATSTEGEDPTPADFTPIDLTESIAAIKTRKEYGNYYYPYDIGSNKQDRVIFRMKQSTGKKINPQLTETTFQRSPSGGEIKGSVTLPITNGIKDSNVADWGKGTMNPIEAFMGAAAFNFFDAASTKGKTVGDVLGGVTKQAKETITNDDVRDGINVFLAQQATGIQNLTSRATGAIANPNMELLFNAPALRAFDFTFQMSPRDSHEANQIKSIINFFKQGMAVKTTSTNVFLKAPNYFEIEYITFDNNGSMMQHPSINVIKTCALLTCAVDYTPNNSYMTYSDEFRSMISYTMNLQFSELDPIYESDYYDNLGMRDSDAPSAKIGY